MIASEKMNYPILFHLYIYKIPNEIFIQITKKNTRSLIRLKYLDINTALEI